MNLSRFCLLFPALFILGFSSSSVLAGLLNCAPHFNDQLYSQSHKQTATYSTIYAILSHNAYRNEAFYFKLPDTWRKVRTYADSTGLNFQVYENNKDGDLKEAVMVFSGTESTKDWLNGNFSSKQFIRSRPHLARFMQKYRNTPKVVTGHSLGGALALFASYEFAGLTAVGFNTPPRKTPDFIPANYRLIINEKGDFSKKFGSFWYPHRWMDSGNQPGVYYQQYDFVPPSIIKAHDSLPLAYGLLRVGSLNNPELRQLLSLNCR